MPLVIGTAGHIDHGKTALVRALTGQETDRLREEQERGISIDLGFAYFDAPGGARTGVVDVPGHERFIRNMLAGAHGMDLVLFTVAADDGVMPQSEEHLDILHLLGIRRGIFVVTKTDLVDAARVAAVREEIEILTVDTTLEGAPIVPVSTVTGAGLDALRAEIGRQLAAPVPPPPAGPFRMPVDRSFVMRGHGVVVTGTAVAGTVREGDAVRVLPRGEPARVRSLQVHGVPVAEAGYGQRVAMNLAGVERQDLGRGDVVCDPSLARATARFDADVELRPAARRPLVSHTAVRVHIGTAEVLGKLVLLEGRTEIAPRARGWAQLVLAEPVLAVRGDRFVFRDATARRTLGGGIVVNPFADRHPRGQAGVGARLVALRDGDPASAALSLLELVPDFACEVGTLAQALGVEAAVVPGALAGAVDVLAIPDAKAPDAFATRTKYERLVTDLVELVGAAHRAHPMERGVEMERLRSQLATDVSTKTFRWCVDRLVADGLLAREESLVRLPSHTVTLGDDSRALGERALERLMVARFMPPDLRQLAEDAGLDRRRLADVLGVLEREGRVVRVAPDLYYARTVADEAAWLLAEHCRTHGEIAAATFRDLIGASRKFSIALLDWFDRTGVTTRVGDLRRLRR